MRHEYQVACDTYSKDARYLRKKGKVAAKAQSVPSTSRAEDGDHAKQDPPRHQTKVEGVDGDASTDVVECDEDDPVLLNLLQLNVEDIIEMAQQVCSLHSLSERTLIILCSWVSPFPQEVLMP